MGPILDWNGKLTVPKALQRGHDEARAELVRASMEGGRIAKAGKRVADLCLPHFEHEEKTVFPVLALLPYLEQGTLRPEMKEVMPMIFAFRAKHDALEQHHQLIVSAIEDLLQAAHAEKNREMAEFAYNMRAHERIEDEVIYPTVVLIGKYLQEKLAN
jgi:hemerythrin superfamily protein